MQDALNYGAKEDFSEELRFKWHKTQVQMDHRPQH